MPSRTALAPLLAAAAAVVALGAGRPAEASLLEDRPKLVAFQLDDARSARLPLLQSFHEASIERPGPMRTYLASPWGRWGHEPWWTLSWLGASAADEATADDAPDAAPETLPLEARAERLFGFEPRAARTERPLRIEPELPPTWLSRLLPGYLPPELDSTGASLRSNGFDALWFLRPLKPKPDWRCRRRPVTFVRYGGESDRFELVRCDGSVAPEALDRLTLMDRLPEVPRPGPLLPDEPDADAIKKGEWLPGVRVVNPRLLWAMQRIADAFPWRTIYVFSGYRQKKKNEKPGSHHSMHNDARAMDIYVMGIRNADLFRFCRTLEDVGCGYYPNSKFVHVDVRKPGTGHAFWVDISGPGEPSHYVDAWPGVVDKGALVWDPRGGSQPGKASSDAACTTR
ncbi:MAG TPA: D-Ala-D-Ala carboxypeptidase family metallohydrolase [Minicystis sp.]|nr:D-Ala-D-Ala carboxypeptidase family metallohydrolase [Minicystis sp.]